MATKTNFLFKCKSWYAKILLAFLLTVLSSQRIHAFDFVVDSIYYKINEDKVSVSVTYLRKYESAKEAVEDRLLGLFTGSNNYYWNIKDIVIPSNVIYEGNTYSVTGIGEYAFSYCSSLTSIEIPNSVTHLEEYALQGCTSLISIKIGNGVINIGDYTFNGCTGLTSIEIPNRVTNIGRYTFAGCIGLTSIKIPYSVTTIGDYAFKDCTGFTSIEVPFTVTNFGVGVFDGCTGLTSIDIKATIEDYAFFGCTELTSIEISNSVTSIGEFAFSGSGITSITIPSSVTSIGEHAFSGCEKLERIVFEDGETVLKLGSITEKEHADERGLFDGCPIVSVYLGRDITWTQFYSFGVGDIYYEKYSPFGEFRTIKDVTIGKSVKDTGRYTFVGCSSLESVKIADGVKTISHGAFSGCMDLKSIEIPNSVTRIGDYAFENCHSLSSINIPNSVEEIGQYAFYQCFALKSICISSSVKSVGKYAFHNTNITSLTIENSSTEIGEGAFSWCLSLAYIDINCKRIRNNWFPDSKSIKEVRLGDEVQTIEASVFSNCANLTSITIPNSVTKIGDDAFNGCRSVKQIVIGEGLEDLGNNAFANCRALEDVYCYAFRYPTASSNAFADSYIDYATLHVPAQSLAQYEGSVPWGLFMKIVPLGNSDPKPSGIDDIFVTEPSAESLDVEYFTIDGKQLNQPQKGFNIIRMSDGSTKKVFVK